MIVLASLNASANDYIVKSSSDLDAIVADTKLGNNITVQMTLTSDDIAKIKTIATTMSITSLVSASTSTEKVSSSRTARNTLHINPKPIQYKTTKTRKTN